MSKLKYTCIFGGGSVRGFCYVGAIKALKELGVEITSFAGSSVGAVFGSLYSAGYSEEEIFDIASGFNNNMFRDINIGFGGDFSLSKGDIFLNWLRDKIESKVWGNEKDKKPVKFKDLKHDVYIITTDLITSKPYVFSKQRTPDVEVAFAVRASASMPGLLKPIQLESNGSILVDGDLTKSWPVWKTDKSLCSEDARVLEFRLEGSMSCRDIKNPFDYFNIVYNTFSNLCTDNVISDYGKKDKFDYIVLDTKDLSIIDFNLSFEQRQELINLGYEKTIKYFKETLTKKRCLLLPMYEAFYSALSNFGKALKTSKYEHARNSLNSVLVLTQPMFNYIDTCFYSKLTKLSELLEKNKHSNIFSYAKIDNVESIISENDDLKNNLQCIISDFKEYINLNTKNY